MNGLFLINKPKNYTSRDVVNVVSKILNTKKIGHTGTLDPIATGLLILTIGAATKLSDYITSDIKEYIATFKFGIETDTLDITGKVINKKDLNITKEDLLNSLTKFNGNIIQEVPKYSAVKINGKKLYEYARANIDIDLPKREIIVYELELLEFSSEIKIRCLVSKGTYIRSLIRDIGYSLNTYATMTSLIRTKQGNFNIENSFTLDDIKNNNYKIITLEEYFYNYPKLDIDDDLYKKINNGNKIENINNYEIVRIYYKDKLIAIYKEDNNSLKPYIKL
jgi:tRNA pseudouridine55 synthase